MKIKYFIITFFNVLIISLGNIVSAQENDISVDKFSELLKIGYKVIDVRTPEEYAEEHIPGAININFLQPNFGIKIDKFSKQDNYLLYCNSGIRSQKAAKIMANKGFISVHYLSGGYDAWKEQNEPFEK